MGVLKLTREKIQKVELINRISGQNVYDCYQCGRCTSGCPSADEMDIVPSQTMKFLQIGEVDKVVESNTPWVCLACLVCSVRCPKGIDIAAIMEALRLVKLRTNYDFIHPNRIPEEDLEELPPIALVSAFRKMTP